jgi:site-specific DNA-cytosine methylase
MTLTAVDCQGFAGGFTLGTVQAGFELVAKREHLGGFGVAACEANRHLLGDGWQAQLAQGADWEPVPGVDLVFGNPPCSGFSVGSNREFRGADSPINHCMWDLVRYAARCQPRAIAFESVAPAFTREDGRAMMSQLRTLLEELTGDRWALSHVKHDAYALGNVQTRRRYFWVALRGDQPLRVDPAPLNWGQVLWDAIGDLEDVPLSWELQPHEVQASEGRYLRESLLEGPSSGFYQVDLDGHHPHNVDSIHWNRMQALLRGDWHQGETVEQAAKRYYSRNGRLPLPWTEREAKKMEAKEWRSSFWPTVRWRADRPAKVVHGGALYNAVHPTLPRTLTHREVARVMGFPDTWRCLPWAPERGGYLFWGKGITVQAGRWLAAQLLRQLNNDASSGYAGQEVGDREWLIELRPAKVKRSEEVLL